MVEDGIHEQIVQYGNEKSKRTCQLDQFWSKKVFRRQDRLDAEIIVDMFVHLNFHMKSKVVSELILVIIRNEKIPCIN